jgi:hypothetical protein
MALNRVRRSTSSFASGGQSSQAWRTGCWVGIVGCASASGDCERCGDVQLLCLMNASQELLSVSRRTTTRLSFRKETGRVLRLHGRISECRVISQTRNIGRCSRWPQHITKKGARGLTWTISSTTLPVVISQWTWEYRQGSRGLLAT